MLLYSVFWHKAVLLLLPIGSFFCLKLCRGSACFFWAGLFVYCTSLFSFFQLQCLLLSSDQIFVLDCILMCWQSQNKCNVDVAASKGSSVANARQLVQRKRWKNLNVTAWESMLSNICFKILIFVNWYFLFSQQKDQNPAECKQQWSSVSVALRITCTVIA